MASNFYMAMQLGLASTILNTILITKLKYFVLGGLPHD